VEEEKRIEAFPGFSMQNLLTHITVVDNTSEHVENKEMHRA
jgi:hypothetical protein